MSKRKTVVPPFPAPTELMVPTPDGLALIDSFDDPYRCPRQNGWRWDNGWWCRELRLDDDAAGISVSTCLDQTWDGGCLESLVYMSLGEMADTRGGDWLTVDDVSALIASLVRCRLALQRLVESIPAKRALEVAS